MATTRRKRTTRSTSRGGVSRSAFVVFAIAMVAAFAGFVCFYPLLQKLLRPRYDTRTFELKYAKANEVAAALSDMCKQLGLLQASVALPDARTVTVAGTPEVLAACTKTVADIDRKPKQVYVEARFFDLLAADMERLGVDWGMFNSMTLTGTAGAGVNGSGEMGKSGWSNAGFYKGTLTSSELDIVLNAIRGNEANRMFANPRVVVSSGKTATVDITTKRPNVIISSKRTTGNGNNNFDVSSTVQTLPGTDKLMFANESFFWWGINLTVDPYVAEDGIISTRIISSVSDLSDKETQPEGQYVEVSAKADGEALPTSKYPIIDMKRIETEFSLKSGETAVIGGLSKTEYVDVVSGIPYLWKIPIIGERLFGSTKRTKLQREIVVLVTMGLVDPERPDRAAGLPRNAVMTREFVTGREKEPGDYEVHELKRAYNINDEMHPEKSGGIFEKLIRKGEQNGKTN